MSNPVVDKLRQSQEDKIKVLSTGVRVIVDGISTFEIQEINMAMETVRPPIVRDPETGRDIENYDDPHYKEAVTEQNLKRGLLVLDAMLIGVTLVDGLPQDDGWINVLRFKEKRGLISLADLDLNNPIEKEYAFKKYVAFIDSKDWEILQGKVEEVSTATAKADAMFPSNEERAADNGSSSQEGSEGS